MKIIHQFSTNAAFDIYRISSIFLIFYFLWRNVMNEKRKNTARIHPKTRHDDLSYFTISLNIGTGTLRPEAIKIALTKKFKIRKIGRYTLGTRKGYIKTGMISNRHDAAVADKHNIILSLTKYKASKGCALVGSSNSFYKSSVDTSIVGVFKPYIITKKIIPK